jgi:hypothetical protein
MIAECRPSAGWWVAVIVMAVQPARTPRSIRWA